MKKISIVYLVLLGVIIYLLISILAPVYHYVYGLHFLCETTSDRLSVMPIKDITEGQIRLHTKRGETYLARAQSMQAYHYMEIRFNNFRDTAGAAYQPAGNEIVAVEVRAKNNEGRMLRGKEKPRK